jgi:hypothetical protein
MAGIASNQREAHRTPAHAGTFGWSNCLTQSRPVLGLSGMGACPSSIIRPALCRRHNEADARCNRPLNGSRMAASRSPPSSKVQSRSRAARYRSFALYSAWYAALEGSPGEEALVATGRANVPRMARPAPGALPPRAGGRSLILDHSSLLINPRRALCSSPVQSDGKSRRPKRFKASRIEI